MKLHLVTCTYDTLLGATVEIRRYLFQPPIWHCTGCRSWGRGEDLHQAANNHASTCRARPRTHRRP